MKSSILKRSIELNGHKTSVSLEDEFWNGLRTIVEAQQSSLAVVLQSIDAERGTANLSSAIRVFVLNYFNSAAQKRQAAPATAHPGADLRGPAAQTFPG